MKQKTKIILYISIAVIILAVGMIFILTRNAAKPTEEISTIDYVDRGNKYLIALSYDKAVIEYTEAVRVDPMNAEAYIGLAEAYVGMDDMDKAIETLELGYEKTGDEQIREMLEKLRRETEVTTTAFTSNTTEMSTIETKYTILIPDLNGMTEAEAIAACEECGLAYEISKEKNKEVKKGYVIEQSMAANERVEEGFCLNFTISDGKQPYIIKVMSGDKVLKTQQYNSDDVLVKEIDKSYTYEYDSNGTLIKRTYYYSDPSNPYMFWNYDSYGNIIEGGFYSDDGSVFEYGHFTYEHTYDYNGNLVKSKRYYDGNIETTESYIYANGKCTEYIRKDSGVLAWKEYDYNSSGNLVREIGWKQDDWDEDMKWWSGSGTSNQTDIWNEKYNRSGIDFFDESYNLKQAKHFYYDNDNVLSEIRIWNTDDYSYIINPADITFKFKIANGNVKVMKEKEVLFEYNLDDLDPQYINIVNYIKEYEYNENNQLVQEKSYEFDVMTGKKLDETIKYNYSETGKLIKETVATKYSEKEYIYDEYGNRIQNSDAINTVIEYLE